MRRTLLGIVLGGCLLPPSGLAAPRMVRLSQATPDAATTMGIAWTTDSEADPTEVEYGLDPSYGQTATGRSFRASNPLGVVHEVVLEGLRPNTTYHFRVGGPGDWSQDHTFTTLPDDPCESYRVAILGDGRSDDSEGPSPRWDDIFAEVFEYDPRLVLNTGDIVKDGSDARQWDRWLRASEKELARASHLPTMGNHDDGPGAGDSAHYNQVFLLPRNEVTGTEDYYYVTTGNAIFVSLSTMEFKGGASPFAEQAAWLDRVLTEHPRHWKIVFFHHPIYCSEDWLGLVHPPNEESQNAALVPIFDKHHVDLVFYGHNHWYERIGPVRGRTGKPEEGIPVSDFANGTVYVVTGGAGATAYNVVVNLFCPRTPGSQVCSGDHHFVWLEIGPDRLSFVARSTRAQLLGTDAANARVIDSFVIEKPFPGGVDLCRGEPPEGPPDLPPEAPPEPVPEQAGDVSDPAEEVEDVPAPVTDAGGSGSDLPVVREDRGPAPGDVAPAPSDAASPAPDPGSTPGKKGGGCGVAAASPGTMGLLAVLLGAWWRSSRRGRRTRAPGGPESMPGPEALRDRQGRGR